MDQAKVFDGDSFTQQLRPAWTPLNIGLMVLFFVVKLWPLGLAMIAYMTYGKQMGLDFSNFGRTKSNVKRAFNAGPTRTGNTAFDEWREAEIEKLEEERRKLDEARAQFEEHLAELRKAKDREEFEHFKARWERRDIDGDGSKPSV